MMLCGVHPGTAAAEWFLRLRAQLAPHGVGGGAAAKGASSLHRRGLSYPPPTASVGDVPRGTDPLRGAPGRVLKPSALPLQVPDSRIEDKHGRRRSDKISPNAGPISPSGLTKNSSRSTEEVTISSFSSSSRSERVRGSYKGGALEKSGSLRREGLSTADRELVSQFDKLREQRRLLSVKPQHQDSQAVGGPRSVDDHLASSSAPSSHPGRGTITRSSSSAPQKAAYGQRSALSVRSLTAEERGNYVDVGPRVVVLSLGLISPLYRSNYDYFLRVLRAKEASREQRGTQRLGESSNTSARGQNAENLVLLADSYSDLGLHPTVPPYRQLERGGDSASGLLSSSRSRSIDDLGGRLDGPTGRKRKAVGKSGRLPPIQHPP